jgi:hypothetical protein
MNGGSVRTTLVDGDRVRNIMLVDRLLREAPRDGDIALGGQQEIVWPY